AHPPPAGSHIHDGASTRLERRRDLVAHAVEHAAEIDGDGPVPGLDGVLACERRFAADAGIVAGDVEPAERVERAIHEGAARLGIGHIRMHEHGLPTLALDEPDGLLAALIADVRHHDLRALAGIHKRSIPSDTGRSACHDSHFAAELSHMSPRLGLYAFPNLG